MVQEVQTGVGITNETTLETIEAIGTSSFKIVEGRQTRGERYSSGCTATGNVYWTYKYPGSQESGEVKSSNTSITSNYGKQEMIMSNGGIRVPSAGTYQITLTRGVAGTTSIQTIIIKAGGKTIYTKSFDSANSETVTLYTNLGKFDTIEIWGSYKYMGTATTANLSFATQPTLTIGQL